jgi:inward rectifier potassium channel
VNPPTTTEPTRFPKVVAKGTRLAFHADLYHAILRLSWPAFFAFITLAFALTNVVFAGLYEARPGCIQNAGSFLDLFFFSVETLATIGYGEMTPQTPYAHTIVSIEALIGIVATAIITGLTFARFARPTAKVLFSNKMIIAPRDGVPHLTFRVANWRRNQIVEARISVFVLGTERTREGEVLRKPIPLALVRDSNPFFALSWTVMHKIDESSPFHGNGMAELLAQKADIFLTLTGLDETLMQTITARFRYTLDDVVAGVRFVDVLTIGEDGIRTIDYDKFHDVVPLEPTGMKGS